MARPDESDVEREHAEQTIELFLGKLLRVMVIATSAVVIVGGALFLPGALRQPAEFGKFVGEPEAFRSVGGILHDALSGNGRAIVEAGLLLLVATPILRVGFSALAFLHERDYLYVFLTLVVLGLLIFSLLGG